MNRLAIFVEGQTEQLFIEKLIYKIAGIREFSISIKQASGGKKNIRKFTEITTGSESVKYFILIVDCGTDGKVKSDISEQYENLKKAGYKKIIGVRDVYPVHYDEIVKLRQGLLKRLPIENPTILFILSIMEIEAWILAEYTHFPRINHLINHDRIKKELGIDVINNDLSKLPRPSLDLGNIYWLEKIRYEKTKLFVTKILSALDYDFLNKNVKEKFPDLKTLYLEFNSFFGYEEEKIASFV